MAACKTCWNCPWNSYQMHLFFVMRATANQKQTTKLQTQERTPKSRFLKVLGYGNYNCFKEIDSCLGLSETKCLGKPVFWGVSKLHSEEGRAGLQEELKVSKLFMEPAWEVSSRLPTTNSHRILNISNISIFHAFSIFSIENSGELCLKGRWKAFLVGWSEMI